MNTRRTSVCSVPLTLLRRAALVCFAAVCGVLSASAADDVLKQWQSLSLAPPAAAPHAKSGFQSLSQVTGVRGTVWRPIGPSPIRQDTNQANGRVTAIAVNPYNPLEIYLGAAGGGVWRSRDFGTNWFPLLDEQAALGIGEPSALALDPNDTDTIYVGTSGRGVLNLSRGILKSTDGGGSWVVLGSDLPPDNTGNADDLFSGHNVNVIRVDPDNSSVIYLASDLGLYRSTDGGLNWTAGANGFGDARSLVVDPTSPVGARVLYAGVSQRGVLKSVDGGVSWMVSLAPGFAPISGFSTQQIARVSVALAPASTPPNPSNIQVVYAVIAGTNGAADLIGLCVTTDAGGAWTRKIAGLTPIHSSGMGYSLSLGVDPASPGNGTSDIVYYGGVQLWRSVNAGTHFDPISNGCQTNAHADFAFYKPDDGSPTHIYTGNDGGIWRSLDNGASWTGSGAPGAPDTINAGGLQIGLVNNLDLANDASGSVVIGAFANRGLPRSAGTNEWTDTRGGEGFDIVFDPVNTLTAYGSSGNFSNGPCTRLWRSFDGGLSWPLEITPWTTSSDPGCFNAPLAVDPNHAGLLYAGGSVNLWQSKDGGVTWRSIGSNGTVVSISVSRVNSNRVAQAVGNHVWVSTNAQNAANVTWRDVTRNLPARPLTRIAFDPNDANVLIVTLAGTGGGHVFRATLNAASWTDISPPVDLPIHALALDGAPTPTAIYLGAPLGVLRSVDNGQSWTVLDDFHLPNVPVTDLALHPRTGRLLAGTYGRGVFEFKEPDGPVIAINVVDPDTLFADTTLDFGTLCIGTKKRLTLQVFNVGNANLDVTSIYRLMGSPAFRVVLNPSTPLVIGPNEEVDFTLEFTANVSGEQKAIVRVSSDDPTAPWVDFIVTGQGIAPLIATSLAHNGAFGDVAINRPNEDCGFADLPLTINNPSQCDLVISNLTSSNPGEFFAPDTMFFPLVIHAGDSMELWLRFSPTNTGTRAATFTLANNSSNAPTKTVSVSGRGTVNQRISSALASGGNFGSVPAFCGYSDLLLTINNSGACSLTISNITTTSAAFLAPGLAGLPLTIEPGDSLPVTIRFAPATPGAFAASVQIASDDPVTPTLTLAVSGQGSQPLQLAGVIADTGSFGTIAAGTFVDQPLTLNNAGNCPLTISAITLANVPPVPGAFLAPGFNPPLVINPGASIDIPIRFAPAAVGAFSGTVQVIGGPLSAQLLAVPVTGVATSPPPPRIVGALPDSGYFGAWAIGCEFHDLPLTINNAGGTDLIIAGMDTTTVEFFPPGVVSYPIVIHPGDSIQFPIRYVPMLFSGPSSDTLTITNNDPLRPVMSLSLTGFALPGPGINAFIADGGNFGPVAVCDFRDLNITLNNTGRCDLLITGLRSIDPAFILPGEFPNAGLTLSFPLVIHPGDSLQLPIRFQPPAPGNYIGAIVITNNATGPVQVGVQGTGLKGAALATAFPDNGNFGSVPVCEFRDLPLTINNTGHCDLVVTRIFSPVAAFQMPSVVNYPLVVHAGDSLQVSIRFAPPTAGNYLAAVSVESNGGTNQVGVFGVGLPRQRLVTVVPDTGWFGGVAPCEFRDLPLTINNAGNCPLTISSLYALPNLLCGGNASGNGAFVNLTNIACTTNVTFATNIMGSITNITAATNVACTTNVTTAVASGGCNLLMQGCLAQLFEVPTVLSFPLVVAPGDSIEIPIRFAPKTCGTNGVLPLGTNFGFVAIFSDDPTTPIAFASFRGVVQDWQRLATVIADDGDFGAVELGDFRDMPLTLNNTGKCDLLITSLAITHIEDLDESFFLPAVQNFPLVIHPGDSLEVPIRFRPLFEGAHPAVVTIRSNDPRSPHYVNITGHGSTNAPRFTITNVVIRPGSNGSPNLSFRFINNGPLTVNQINLGGGGGPLAFLNPIVIFPGGVPPGGGININVAIVPFNFNVGFAQFNLRIGLGNNLFLGPLNFRLPSCIDIRNAVALPLGPGGTNYSVQFTVVNQTSSDITTLIIPNPPPGVALTPQIIQLPAPLAPGASMVVTLNAMFSNGAPAQLCLDIVAHSADCADCCTVRYCFPIRPQCGTVSQQRLEPTTNLHAAYSFNLENRSGVPVGFLVFDGGTNCLAFPTPVLQLNPPLQPGETRRITNNVTYNFGCDGSNVCFRLTLYDTNFLSCCALEICPTFDDSEADLYVLKSAGTAQAPLGGRINYIITYGNSGPSNALDVTVTDLLPPGAVIVEVSGNNYLVQGNRVTWDFYGLPPGYQNTLTLSVVVTNTGFLTNTATITYPGYDPNLSNNTYRAVVEVTNAPPSDLLVHKTASTNRVAYGDIVEFTITVSDSVPALTPYARLEDVMPPGFIIVNVFPPPNDPAFPPNPYEVRWQLGPGFFPPQFTIVARAVQAGDWTNTARLTLVVPGDINPTNNESSVGVTVYDQLVDLSVTKTATAAGVLVGSNVTFNVVVSNAGPSTASNIQVQDMLPPGFSFVAADFAYSMSLPGWTIASLAPGASTNLFVTARGETPGAWTNVASLAGSSPADTTPGNNTGSVMVVVSTAGADLVLTKTASTNQVNVDDLIYFDVVLSNAGPAFVGTIQVRDILPSGFQYVGNQTSAGFYDPSQGIWSVSPLPPGDEQLLRIFARAALAGTWTNVARIIFADTFDPVPGNNVARAEVIVSDTFADLSVRKSASAANVATGAVVNFTVVLSNAGPATATNIIVRDVLPAGFEFVTANESYSMIYPGWHVDSLAPGAASNLTVSARAMNAGVWTNTAEITGSSRPDPVSTNNESSVTVNAAASSSFTDLAVTKTVFPSSVNVGDLVHFFVTVSNRGPSAASNVVVNDTPPAGLLVNSTGVSPGTSYNLGSGQWFITNLFVGNAVTLDIAAFVQSAGSFANTATLAASTPADTNAANNSATATVNAATPGGGAPAFTSITRGSNSPSLRFTTTPGSNYVVQFKSRIDDAFWSDLTVVQTATGTVMTVVDPGPIGFSRFYRVSSPATNGPQYTINAFSGPNGSISPTGAVARSAGANVGFTATPNAGFAVDTWFLNGTPALSNATTLAITNLQSNYTLNVTFRSSSTNAAGTNRFDNNTPLAIPDTNTVMSSIFASGLTGHLASVTVSFFVTHTFDGDLQFDLIGPDNTTVRLITNHGSSGDNFGSSCSSDNARTTIADAAATAISSGAAPFVGTFRPESPLTPFVGKAAPSINGQWRLRIADTQALDSGALNCWSLTIATGP